MNTCRGCLKQFEQVGHWTRTCEDCRSDNVLLFWCSYTCKQCGQAKRELKRVRPELCSQRCKNFWAKQNGSYERRKRRKVPNYDLWVEQYGREEADRRDVEFRKNVSSGVLAADMSNRTIANKRRFKMMNEANKGKTLEEIYGKEKASAMRSRLSECARGSLNPAFGKVYARGGRSVKGHYKGFFFRSLLEYSFMKHLEKKGFDLARDVRYERFRVPYSFEGRDRTYTVDFHVLPERIVYEVKPRYIKANPPAEQLAKWEAAKSFLFGKGCQFKVVTEEDFEKFNFESVYGVDTDVEWDERTFGYFRRTK